MTDHTKLKIAADAVKQSYADLCEHGGDEFAEAWNTAELAYDDEANPDVVLALIAENDAALREATSLAMATWRRHYAKDSPNFQTFEKASSVIGQIDNMVAGLMSDLEKLRAEVAGFKTGYEAYERVNAELKAEVEGLRSLLGQSALAATTLRTDAEVYANHSGFNRAFVDLIRARSGVEVGHGYGSSKYPQQADVVAAMGKGEQS